MNSLANELDNISDSWTNDAGEKYYIIKQLNIAGSEVASICSGYKTYTTNIERVLDVLKDFAEFLGVVGTEKYTFKTKNITKSTKTKVKMDTASLKACGNRIVKLGNDIEQVQLDYKSIAARVDDQIYRMLSGKISSLNSLNKRLDTQANQIVKTGKAIIKICEKYELAEKNIAKKAVELASGKHVTYGDGNPSSATIPRKEGGSYQMPNMTYYSISSEVGGLANSDVKGKKEVLAWIQKRNNGLPRKSEYPKGYCTKYTYDKLASVGIVLGNAGNNKTVGNGNQWYSKIKNKKVTWSSKYNCECVDGNNALETIIANNNGEAVYNIVLSYKHAYRDNPSVPQQYDNCGHVMMIDAIIDGVVYFSDNYYNKASSMSLKEFKKYYNSHYGNILGAAHFTSK